MDEVFGALADSTRRIIIEELAERDGQSLFEICGRLAMRHGIGISRQAITKHLQVLEKASIIRTERSGRSRLHYLRGERLGAVGEWVAELSRREQEES